DTYRGLSIGPGALEEHAGGCELRNRRRANAALEVPALTEVDLPLAIVERHPADFTGVPVMAAMQPAADHHAGADARAERQKPEVVDVPRRALPALAERRHVGVVVDLHRRLEPRLHELAERHVRPAREIVGADDAAGRHVGHAWRADADRKQLAQVAP